MSDWLRSGIIGAISTLLFFGTCLSWLIIPQDPSWTTSNTIVTLLIFVPVGFGVAILIGRKTGSTIATVVGTIMITGVTVACLLALFL